MAFQLFAFHKNKKNRWDAWKKLPTSGVKNGGKNG